MLNIVYPPSAANLAEKMQTDLGRMSLKLEKHYTFVLVNADTTADSGVQHATDLALEDKHIVVPVLLDDSPVPDKLEDQPVLDMRRGYKRGKLIDHVRRLELGRPVLQRNTRLLLILGGTTLVIFVVGILSIASGFVRPPLDEFATEEAINNAMIEEFLIPTLEGVLPRTTEDALNFPATVQAQPTRNRVYLALTGTALPLDRQATLDAIATAAPMTETARAEATATATAGGQ